MLLKWLGEQGAQAPLKAAVAVSVPYLLHESVAHMNRGFARLYQWKLVTSLKASVRRKARHRAPPLPLAELERIRDFFEFDDRITGPLHGFRGAMHYYTQSSSRQYLGRIRIPTLLVQAEDDPFMHRRVVPETAELSSTTTLELLRHGGHVGFVGGRLPWRPRYWLDERIPAWLRAQLEPGN
jgi:predicted alpha/beta-fold hydrolase